MEGTETIVQVAGGAIVDSLARPTRLLAARRTAPPQFAGMWEFPGGKVEPGEGHEAALLRELREELGVGVRLGPEICAPARGGWPLSAKAAMRVWFAEITEGSPSALEDHDELRWIPLARDAEDRLTGLPWIPADYPIVEAVRVEAERLVRRA
ncbi:(deoxy)nucleoside triphosphate pyrophosphohydrolase [Sinomonas sp. JGH33]|uniref:8-oxo-dGTP diphosphatase n=1 Tax=Sinomonas terricola TaxID=3110330 RepID=A0ABU5T4D2_9MICC|nr:(deoxy)nucleoside triphosphate pyrophosphohydrolase [Sinomonas sp. JGH33]MEA5454522.1 (deoxy)nucleoside triphosphate pyrophosphohydrolase [Sinomonas sp. JGH33]